MIDPSIAQFMFKLYKKGVFKSGQKLCEFGTQEYRIPVDVLEKFCFRYDLQNEYKKFLSITNTHSIKTKPRNIDRILRKLYDSYWYDILPFWFSKLAKEFYGKLCAIRKSKSQNDDEGVNTKKREKNRK